MEYPFLLTFLLFSMIFYVVQECGPGLYLILLDVVIINCDCLSGEADYLQRKRNREDDQQPRESSKRTSDHESRRNFDPDSRPVIFKCIEVLYACEHSLKLSTCCQQLTSLACLGVYVFLL
jgi:hypothetical protein